MKMQLREQAEAVLVWPKSVEPAGVFGPVMMFLACLLALRVSFPHILATHVNVAKFLYELNHHS